MTVRFPILAQQTSPSEAGCSSLSDKDLLSVQRPAQYTGGELNSVKKDDAAVELHFALAFPDTYEVGMSHLGIQILYEVLNSKPYIWAERAYMPEADMETLLHDKKISLRSLEAQRPLSEFDVLGISLQYELCGTNILSMLDLAGIPFYSKDRDESQPLIIAGGPYSYHPEALAPFFDAFFLGDAEEAILEVAETVRHWKKQTGSCATKNELLKQLATIEGVYVPAQFKPTYNESAQLIGIEALNPEKPVVVRRLLPSMEGAPYVKRPIVPNINTVHNRLSVEVMRGCVRGCRFCQAGYLYRPQRERSPQEIVEMIDAALPQTGYEELSLLSLSTADYCSVVPLLKHLMDRYAQEDKLAISFPSTRVDSLTPEVLEQVQRVRRTGFTVAPEAGTQRLRDVINKGVSDEQILETCSNVFRMGWSGIKLYFMIGLPTETDEDLEGIISIAQRVKSLPEARNKSITVSVSTHVPKPHTPFQWAEQISPAETIRKQRLLAQGLRKTGVNFRYHDAFSSFLEGVFCRAERDLSAVIVRAYELGCRLDAWAEHLKEETWLQAFLDCNVDPNFYLRERNVEETLPWDHLSCGIPKSYFLKEYQRALRDRSTPDCLTKSCSICGACDYDVKRNVLWPRDEAEKAFRQTSPGIEDEQRLVGEQDPPQPEPVARYRIRYTKRGLYRMVGHLELVHIFHRAARRADLPLAYTRGFHPMPRFSFGPPLQLGISSADEYVDAYFISNMNTETLAELLNQKLPENISVIDVSEVKLNSAALSRLLSSFRYRVSWEGLTSGTLATWSETGLITPGEKTLRAPGIAAFQELAISRVPSTRRGAKRKHKQAKEFQLDKHIRELEFEWENGTLCAFSFTLDTNPDIASPRVTEIVNLLTGFQIGECWIEKQSSTCVKNEQPEQHFIPQEYSVELAG